MAFKRKQQRRRQVFFVAEYYRRVVGCKPLHGSGGDGNMRVLQHYKPDVFNRGAFFLTGVTVGDQQLVEPGAEVVRIAKEKCSFYHGGIGMGNGTIYQRPCITCLLALLFISNFKPKS